MKKEILKQGNELMQDVKEVEKFLKELNSDGIYFKLLNPNGNFRINNKELISAIKKLLDNYYRNKLVVLTNQFDLLK